MVKKFESLCQEEGIRITGQRKIIAQVIQESSDHPDVDKIYQRSNKIDPKISIATVYRTVKLLEELGIIDKLDFGNGKSRYEFTDCKHHHHLIDITTGKVIEFENQKLEELKKEICDKLGYELVDHKLELYGKPKQK